MHRFGKFWLMKILKKVIICGQERTEIPIEDWNELIKKSINMFRQVYCLIIYNRWLIVLVSFDDWVKSKEDIHGQRWHFAKKEKKKMISSSSNTSSEVVGYSCRWPAKSTKSCL